MNNRSSPPQKKKEGGGGGATYKRSHLAVFNMLSIDAFSVLLYFHIKWRAAG